VIRGKEGRYYEGNEIFDASPVLSEFQMSVKELFSKVLIYKSEKYVRNSR
jgi:hypothetical protein